MRVLVWTQYFWPENFRINELTATLGERGIWVTVLTGKPNYPDGVLFPGYRASGIQRECYADADVVRVPIVPRGSASALRLAINYLSFIFSGYVVAPFALRGRSFDVVFVYAPSPLLQALPAILVARLKRAPLVVWVQDLWPESLAATGFVRNRLALGAVEAAVRHIYRRADSILIQSEAFRDPVARLTDDPNKIQYYPNTATPPAKGEGGGTSIVAVEMRNWFSVVFAGNLGVAQSVETILGAAELVRMQPTIRFFVVGSGSRDGWLEEQISRRKLDNVILTGRLPETEMPAVFTAASALLVTLRAEPAFALTVPSKLQAYLAAGRPVIAGMDGEGARIVDEAQAGPTCPAGDVQALAAAVLKLYAMTAEGRSRLGDNGRRYFEMHFDPNKRVRELIQHFEDIADRRRGGGP